MSSLRVSDVPASPAQVADAEAPAWNNGRRDSDRPSELRRGLQRFCRNRGALAGVLVLCLFAVVALAAPLATTYDPEQTQLDQKLLEPSAAHLLGTDHLGRDILARLAYGARYSLLIGFAAVSVGLVIGVPCGTLCGFYGGWLDLVVQRVIDVFLSLPGFLLALSLVAVLGVGINNVILAVGLGVVPAFVRLTRATTLSIRSRAYVDAARAAGARGPVIIVRHILPNALAPMVIQATLGIGATILTAAGLGFLGLGVQPPTPEWGAMLGEGRSYIFSNPNLATFPGIAIFLTVLCINLAGDGLRDALDPSL
ncbi:MAG: ABC transporter permease [Chloroflexi bacterium]|nr:ABC transporter permease [Chloroflexota bacterium]